MRAFDIDVNADEGIDSDDLKQQMMTKSKASGDRGGKVELGKYWLDRDVVRFLFGYNIAAKFEQFNDQDEN